MKPTWKVVQKWLNNNHLVSFNLCYTIWKNKRLYFLFWQMEPTFIWDLIVLIISSAKQNSSFHGLWCSYFLFIFIKEMSRLLVKRKSLTFKVKFLTFSQSFFPIQSSQRTFSSHEVAFVVFTKLLFSLRRISFKVWAEKFFYAGHFFS
jgi:hypothetical protein